MECQPFPRLREITSWIGRKRKSNKFPKRSSLKFSDDQSSFSWNFDRVQAGPPLWIHGAKVAIGIILEQSNPFCTFRTNGESVSNSRKLKCTGMYVNLNYLLSTTYLFFVNWILNSKTEFDT